MVRNKSKESVKDTVAKAGTKPDPNIIQVNHTNAPLLTVKYLEMINARLARIEAKLNG